MAAHLHRYKSELHRVENILLELQLSKFDLSEEGSQDKTNTSNQQDGLKIDQLLAQLGSINGFSDEIERKVQNILTLVSDRAAPAVCMILGREADVERLRVAFQPNPGDQRPHDASYSHRGPRG